MSHRHDAWPLAVSLVQLLIGTGGIVVTTVVVALGDRERGVRRATVSEVRRIGRLNRVRPEPLPQIT